MYLSLYNHNANVGGPVSHRVQWLQVLNLESQMKAVQKAHEGTKLNLTQAIEACNFATKKRRAAERKLAKLEVRLSARCTCCEALRIGVLLLLLLLLLLFVTCLLGRMRVLAGCLWHVISEEKLQGGTSLPDVLLHVWRLQRKDQTDLKCGLTSGHPDDALITTKVPKTSHCQLIYLLPSEVCLRSVDANVPPKCA